MNIKQYINKIIILSKGKYLSWSEYSDRIAITEHILFISDTTKQNLKNRYNRVKNGLSEELSSLKEGFIFVNNRRVL